MSSAVHEFTTTIPVWKPYVTPLDLADATQEQLDALKVTPSNTKVSDYVLVLAHDVETLKHRSPLFNAVMYNRGGMSRAEREIGAVGASIVNRCIYCAAVHASRYNQLTKDESVINAIFSDGADAEIESGMGKAIGRIAKDAGREDVRRVPGDDAVESAPDSQQGEKERYASAIQSGAWNQADGAVGASSGETRADRDST